MDIIEVEIANLKAAEYNPRAMTDREASDLTVSLLEFGMVEPIVVNKAKGRENVIIGGHQRYEINKRLGKETIPVVYVDIPDIDKEKELNLRLNKNLGHWDFDMLANFDEELLKKSGFDSKDLDKIFKGVTEDEAPELSQDPAISKLGEVYQLGRHRLMCGDATKLDDVEKLMDGKKADMVFTDPPYGIDVVGDEGNIGGGTKQAPTTKFRKVIGDDTEFDPSFVLNYSDKVFIWGGNYFAHLLPKGGRWFVWDKNRPEGLTLSDCELAWSNLEGVKVQKYKSTWDGYHVEGEKSGRIHPNQKSLKLLSDILKDISIENDIILDLFGGSGSTLIACEQTSRICHMMELDPKYVDVIRKRYAKFIGKEDEWQKITQAV